MRRSHKDHLLRVHGSVMGGYSSKIPTAEPMFGGITWEPYRRGPRTSVVEACIRNDSPDSEHSRLMGPVLLLPAA